MAERVAVAAGVVGFEQFRFGKLSFLWRWRFEKSFENTY
jgi:hypothetical protein